MRKLIFICNFVHSQQQKSEPALKRMEPVNMDIKKFCSIFTIIIYN